MSETTYSNKRIAKNTLVLYARSIVVMAITLYTSRVILRQLGVEDYGIYSVVGGLVAMFSLISNALSTSVSRFITYEIGRGDAAKLRKIFSTSVVIQLLISVVVLIVAELVAIWFIRTQMQIPAGRETAAVWVLQCSLVMFCFNLVSVPYNACIIAHEHMTAFAYVSIIDVLLKLGICLSLSFAPFDRLVYYAVLMALSAFVVRLIYGLYCHRHFPESKGRLVFDRQIFKEMLGFSGWSFFTNGVNLFNTQGVNMLINVFFGVTVNAARGLATQVESAVMTFVGNFTTAVNPQITKSYAAGERAALYNLVCRGAKFSFFVMYVMALPLICEAPMVLSLWLTEVPAHTVVFVQLSLVMGMIDCVGTSGFTACMATGHLKKYALIITPIGFLEFPLSWLLFRWGAPVVSTYYLYIAVKAAIIVARMYLLRGMIGLPVGRYLREVVCPVLAVAFLSAVPPVLTVRLVAEGFPRLVLSVAVSVCVVSLSALFVGMSRGERQTILAKVGAALSRLKRK